MPIGVVGALFQVCSAASFCRMCGLGRFRLKFKHKLKPLHPKRCQSRLESRAPLDVADATSNLGCRGVPPFMAGCAL